MRGEERKREENSASFVYSDTYLVKENRVYFNLYIMRECISTTHGIMLSATATIEGKIPKVTQFIFDLKKVFAI